MRYKDIIDEGIVNELHSEGNMVFGRTVPESARGLECDALTFGSDDGRVIYIVRHAGKFEIYNGGRVIFRNPDREAVEAALTKYRLTNFMGVHHPESADKV